MGMNVVSIRKKIDTTKYKEGICRVGFFENAKYEGGKSIAMVARANEFGVPRDSGERIPPRPFMRPAIHENRAKLVDFLRSRYMKALKDNENTMNVLERFGLMVQGLIQAQIIMTNEPPNAPSTVKRKGFNKPLVDTGIMLASVSHQEEEIRK